MGMGLSIQTVEVEWPTEEVRSRCPQCGSQLLLTRYQRLQERAVPPELLAQETEQLCGVCGAPACEETEAIKTVMAKNKSQDLFSFFK
ncbi:hypothetical protein ES703_16080 [subsurface metagenome]